MLASEVGTFQCFFTIEVSKFDHSMHWRESLVSEIWILTLKPACTHLETSGDIKASFKNQQKDLYNGELLWDSLLWDYLLCSLLLTDLIDEIYFFSSMCPPGQTRQL